MDRLLEPVRQAASLDAARKILGELINLEDRASTAVTSRVLSDQKFAHTLVALRNFPEWRDQLLCDQANSYFEPINAKDGQTKYMPPANNGQISSSISRGYHTLGRDGVSYSRTMDLKTPPGRL